MDESRRRPAPWVFSLLILPLSIYTGFLFTSHPFLLDKAGVPTDRIATMMLIINLPGILLFLWAPLVDTKLRRRTWLVSAALATAVFFSVALPFVSASHLNLTIVLLLIPGFTVSLVLCACGGLLVRVVSVSVQSKAAAWKEAGLLGGGALGGALVLWLAPRLPLFLVGLVVAALIALPALVGLTIPEPPPPESHWFRGRLTMMGREVSGVIRSWDRLFGAMLVISPCGACAAQGLLPAIASRYGVGATGVMWVNGVAGGVLLGLGSLCGALIPGDWDRRLTYAGAGLTNALAGIVLVSAKGPRGFLAGTVLYLLTGVSVWPG